MTSINEILYDAQNDYIDSVITQDEFIAIVKDCNVYDKMMNDFAKCNTDNLDDYITEAMTEFISCL